MDIAFAYALAWLNRYWIERNKCNTRYSNAILKKVVRTIIWIIVIICNDAFRFGIVNENQGKKSNDILNEVISGQGGFNVM